MLLHEKYVEDIIEKVVSRLRDEPPVPLIDGAGDSGIFATLDEAVAAAHKASEEIAALPLEQRKKVIAALRCVVLDNLELVSQMAVDETSMGRVDDKIIKNRLGG